MKSIETELTGVIIVEPDFYRDARGFLFDSFPVRLPIFRSSAPRPLCSVMTTPQDLGCFFGRGSKG